MTHRRSTSLFFSIFFGLFFAVSASHRVPDRRFSSIKAMFHDGPEAVARSIREEAIDHQTQSDWLATFQTVPDSTTLFQTITEPRNWSFTRFYWVLLGFTKFDRARKGFTGCYLVLLGFYLVLLGFTGLYLVLLGFT